MPPIQQNQKSVGPIIGIIIIIVVLLVGALYFWGGTLNKSTMPIESPEQISAGTDTVVSGLQTVGVTDSLEDISADLNATDVSSLDDSDNIESVVNSQ
ncbi:MAG: hypothetical protein A2664_01020 [Candidatus Taylorbacteria bacterium RIFCSPHIGHO2_01_FULL_46_22b]|uniref:Uncharacterized protein n=1 Tax=Candidatus Taylorbacteria bacterium RIFCSPHIGHO2_01_FULL_46_22b TaxID=1802301 RepID=A0A1G2M4G3_9BACT|nr:MAG: hypothetical protein A2664_01020 [Candidatus Taylorbacteria bacterium RIFCSPHIGHO2_01_FULL_46_22b]